MSLNFPLRVALVLSLVGGGFGLWYMTGSREITAADPAPTPGGFVPFSHWPQDQKPEVVFVVSGQTFGYLSPCGCSRPQKGGLERRANLMAELRAKGWPVLGLDLGDVSPPKKIPEQDRLKYRTAMLALREMGYVAVGLGKYDFNHDLFSLLGEFTVQHPKDPRPVILSANLAGKGDKPGTAIPREEKFSGGKDERPLVEDVEVITKDPNNGACLPVGIVGAFGPTVYKEIIATDPQFETLDNAKILPAVLAKIAANPAQPKMNVLLYAGTLEEAKSVAEAFPAFNLIVCQIEESEPPQFPTQVNDGKTFIIQVGHKGQNVGVVGVYKTANGYELKYQLVPLGEQYITKPEDVPNHKVLQLLEGYAKQVKDRNLLAKYTVNPLDHPAMIQNPKANLTYIGSDKCTACHPNENKVWGASHHAHAYDSLVKKAVNPGNRQFDGDCVSCHTVGWHPNGLAYKSGFVSEAKTPHLKHNGCENCHGPGSGHAADPKDKKLLAAMTSWRENPNDKMPAKEKLEALAKVKFGETSPVQLTPKEQMTWNRVNSMCMRCHDGENDPKFDLNVNFPKIMHSGFKAKANAGLPEIP